MSTSFWITLFVIAIGFVLVMLPDRDKSVFNFNKDHGPSSGDLVGLVLIILSWCFVMVGIVRKRKLIVKSVGVRNTILVVIMIMAGATLIVSGLQIEKDLLLWMGVLLSILGYGVLLTPAFRKS